MKNVPKRELMPDPTTRNLAAGRSRVAIAGMLAVSLVLIASAGRSNAASESVIFPFAPNAHTTVAHVGILPGYPENPEN